jgi:hypothetical protein
MLCGCFWFGGNLRMTVRATLDELHVIAREETSLASAVLTHPPIIVDHFNVGDLLPLVQRNLVLLVFLIVVLSDSGVSTVSSGAPRVLSVSKCACGGGLASPARRVVIFDLWLWFGVLMMRGDLG